jgi:cytochrome c
MWGTESPAFAAMFVSAIVTASPAWAQDAARGKIVFQACAACHATDRANHVGPGLAGIIGRKAGTAPGFRYSRAMKRSGIVWDYKILDAYLEAPQKVVPGNRMPYAGMKEPRDRADVIAYLSTLNSSAGRNGAN